VINAIVCARLDVFLAKKEMLEKVRGSFLKQCQRHPLIDLREWVWVPMYCMKHTSFCFVLFLLSIAQLAHGGLLCVNSSLILNK